MDGEITAEALERALEEGDPLVVDIRHPPQFERGHIPGSVNIPLTELPAEIERVAGAGHVVTVCPHGEASVRAARLVNSFGGFDGRVDSLAEGLEGWDGPVESGTAESEPSESETGEFETGNPDTAESGTAESETGAPF